MRGFLRSDWLGLLLWGYGLSAVICGIDSLSIPAICVAPMALPLELISRSGVPLSDYPKAVAWIAPFLAAGMMWGFRRSRAGLVIGLTVLLSGVVLFVVDGKFNGCAYHYSVQHFDCFRDPRVGWPPEDSL